MGEVGMAIQKRYYTNKYSRDNKVHVTSLLFSNNDTTVKSGRDARCTVMRYMDVKRLPNGQF